MSGVAAGQSAMTDLIRAAAGAALLALLAGCATTHMGTPGDPLKKELQAHVKKEIGSLAMPDDIRFTATLPKTRSGKIMRRLLRDIAAGKELVGDTSTLEDYAALAKLREEEE